VSDTVAVTITATDIARFFAPEANNHNDHPYQKLQTLKKIIYLLNFLPVGSII
jgi:hypothetical protein